MLARERRALSDGELVSVMESAAESGEMSVADAKMVEGVLRLSELCANDEMTPRVDIVAVDVEEEIEDEDEIKIIRTKKFGIKPMFPEDACVQMELLGHTFFVFCNAETDEVNVVYKRKDGAYGLIEPEF